MPHFISKNMFPADSIEHDGFRIMEPLVNARFPNLSLLPVIYGDDVFFIRCIQRKHDVLYKVDKLTRPSDLLLIKKVLSFMATKLNVITHNLQQTQTKHTKGMQSGYLVNEMELSTLQPDYIEIGFGSGRHILDLAKSNPQKIILGFEIHTPSIRQVINAIAIYGLKNLFICNLDARLGIQALQAKSVEIIFLHFPIPWNKAKHRRVFRRDFLENSFRILKDSGYINMRSDDYEYVKDSIQEALSADYAHFEVLKNQDIKIISKYEARWSNMKKDIYELHIFKHNFIKNEDIKNDTTFSFSLKIPSLQPFCNQKWVQDSVFINIGDLYCAKPNAKHQVSIAQLAFGSFYMPFNTYLVLEQDKSLHYLKTPLHVRSHMQAHIFLCEILKDNNK